MSTTPTRVCGSITPVVLRSDLPRDRAAAYWAESHAVIVRESLPHVVEYNQHHFSKTDHSFWPGSGTVGTLSPLDYDGIAELRFPGVIGQLRNAPRIGRVFYDEQNPFETVIGYQTGPAGGQWWTTGLDQSLESRVVVLFRRRRGTSRKAFRDFIHNQLGPALDAAGARDLRTTTFMRYIAALCNTPGVSHDCPPHRQYHGAVIFGSASRSAIDAVLAAPEVIAIVSTQEDYVIGAHAFAVERTVPGIRANS